MQNYIYPTLSNISYFPPYLAELTNIPLPFFFILAIIGMIYLALFGFKLTAGIGSTNQYGPAGNKCPRCAERGITTYVQGGKHCPKCGQPC